MKVNFTRRDAIGVAALGLVSCCTTTHGNRTLNRLKS
jgi:hypothetical protein